MHLFVVCLERERDDGRAMGEGHASDGYIPLILKKDSNIPKHPQLPLNPLFQSISLSL